MRIIFMGTPDFAVPTLDALVEAGHEIVAVYTQPPRPAGRGKAPRPSPVQARAEALGLPVRTPLTLRDQAAQEAFDDLEADAAVVAAYGLILPIPVLHAPRLGSLNVHASLLPRWRGAAPIQRAILAGDTGTGITIMQMDAGLDTGAMLTKTPVPILETDTAASLHDTLAAAGAGAIVEALTNYPALVPQPQDDAQATYAAKLGKEEARLDWRQPAELLARAVRAYNPAPGAWTLLDGEPLKIWSAQAGTDPWPAEAGANAHAPGEVLRADADQLVVACGSGTLALQVVQPAGGKRMNAAAFLAGRPLSPGIRLGP